MVYEDIDGWKLYVRDVKLKNAETQTVYFFSQRVPKYGTACDLPEDKKVVINKRTGFPFLTRK